MASAAIPTIHIRIAINHSVFSIGIYVNIRYKFGVSFWDIIMVLIHFIFHPTAAGIVILIKLDFFKLIV